MKRWPAAEPPRWPQGDGDSWPGGGRAADELVSRVLWPRRDMWEHQGVTCAAPWDREPRDGFWWKQLRGSREGGKCQIAKKKKYFRLKSGN